MRGGTYRIGARQDSTKKITRMDILSIIIEYGPIVLSMLGVGGCGVLFYKQEVASKDLTNVAAAINNSTAQNEEWRKLLEERTSEVRRLNEKLDVVYHEKSVLRDRLEKSLEKDALAAYYRGLYHASRCDNWNCQKREPPISEEFSRHRRAPISGFNNEEDDDDEQQDEQTDSLNNAAVRRNCVDSPD